MKEEKNFIVEIEKWGGFYNLCVSPCLERGIFQFKVLPILRCWCVVWTFAADDSNARRVAVSLCGRIERSVAQTHSAVFHYHCVVTCDLKRNWIFVIRMLFSCSASVYCALALR